MKFLTAAPVTLYGMRGGGVGGGEAIRQSVNPADWDPLRLRAEPFDTILELRQGFIKVVIHNDFIKIMRVAVEKLL